MLMNCSYLFNCKINDPIYDYSRPMKAAVAAVAEHLAGLVETQLTYSHAHQNTAQVCEVIQSYSSQVSFSMLLWKLVFVQMEPEISFLTNSVDQRFSHCMVLAWR